MKKIQSTVFVTLFLISITIGCSSNSKPSSILVSPTFTSTTPPTDTPNPPTATATFTPTPQSISANNAGQILLLRQFSDMGNAKYLTFLPDGISLVGVTNNQVQIWDLNTGEASTQLSVSDNSHEINCISISADGKLLAAGTGYGYIYLWGIETGEPIGEPFKAELYTVDSLAFSPDGTLLASAGSTGFAEENNIVNLWNVETQEPVGKPLEGHKNWVKQIIFSPDGKLLATRAGDIYLWDVVTGQPFSNPLIKSRGSDFIAFSLDGTTLISEKSGTINFWDIKTGKAIGIPIDEKDLVYSVAISPDGKLIALGLENNIHIWDTQTRQLAAPPLIGHTHWVNGIAFSPNNWWLISAATVHTNEYFLWGLPRQDTTITPTPNN